MFCFQCEQTAMGQGCTSMTSCGKDPITANLQDVLLYVTKGISQYAHRLRAFGVIDKDIDLFVIEALFTTVTNVNFDAERVRGLIVKAVSVREDAKQKYIATAAEKGQDPEDMRGPAIFVPETEIDDLVDQGDDISIENVLDAKGPDIGGLEELVTYGLKGMAAYLDHAIVLGYTDDEQSGFVHEVLNFLTNDNDLDALVAMSMKVGEMNFKTMALLDSANTGTFGHPEPTSVNTQPVAGKCILVSGHDLKDLEILLKQTEGKNVNIYTHGEMLPALAYPQLKKYPHLVGNYGGAWQDQLTEFAEFPGSILMTTNCIQHPGVYRDRIFTTGLVAYGGVKHVSNDDFTPVIEAALASPGYPADMPAKNITVGFGHNAVLGVADKVVDAVKSGAIKHFYLIGGCDGAKPGRNYFTDTAKAAADDTVILTLGCGKYRFNKEEFGDIGGIPRLLDVGQCNDAYGAIVIASALAKAFETDVNSLPLTLIISWYEQKAVAVLLTLLHLGIKNIKLGPSLPAFISPAVLNFLVENFNIAPVSTPEADLMPA
jgi:hydroxylamine reductase